MSKNTVEFSSSHSVFGKIFKITNGLAYNLRKYTRISSHLILLEV